MILPKILFRYSWPYDDSYRNSPRIQKFLEKKGEKYPSQNKIESYIKRAEPIYRKQEKRILNVLSKISGLEWKAKEIKCYVIGMGRPFSDPLTLHICKNYNDFIDTLTHELIHQLQMQNIRNMKKWWRYVNKKYKKEPQLTKNHILLHAIHAKLISTFYGENNLEKRLQIPPHGEYKRSWEIVQREGYKKIIYEFKKRLK